MRSDQDQRREHRERREGEVLLFAEALAPVRGQLVDVSNGGFRAEHNSPALTCGTEIVFQYGSVRGRARVVWSLLVDDRLESGFVILVDS